MSSATIPNDPRIVVLVDMDCFYCQVEEKLDPSLCGQPIAVVQYNAWKGGGIIAVNYPARDRGVTRHMRGDEAARICPEIQLVKVPNVRDKADLSRYRDAGKEVAAVLQTFTPLLERASVDEAYLDITRNVEARLKQMDEGAFNVLPHMLQSTYALGYENIGHFVQEVAQHIRQTEEPGHSDELTDENHQQRIVNNDVRLLIAATVVNDIRAAVKQRTGYDCSAGIAHNKILAKLVCGMNKPNKQTLLPPGAVELLYRTLSVRKIRGMGGKFGEEVCERLKVTHMGELGRFELAELQRHFEEKNALFLYNIARGHDPDPVTVRLIAKNIGCSKNFQGVAAIKGLATLQHWLRELATEIVDRIEKDTAENSRRPRNLIVGFTQSIGGKEVSASRTMALSAQAMVDVDQMAADALDVIKRNTEVFFRPRQQQPAVLNNAIRFLGLTVGKFVECGDGGGAGGGNGTIRAMFGVQTAKANERKRLSEEKRPEVEVCDEEEQGDDDEGADEGKTPEECLAELIAATEVEEHQPEECSATEDIVEQTHEDKSERLPDASPKKSTAQRPFFTSKPKPTIQPQSNGFFAKKPPDVRPQSPDVQSLQSTSPTPTKEDMTGTEPPSDSVYLDDTLEETPAPANDVPAYMKEYAEFQAPVAVPVSVPAADKFERCTTCNRKVPLADVQSHADAHFAFQISQQQRLEYRTQGKDTTITSAVSSPAPKDRPIIEPTPSTSTEVPEPPVVSSPPSVTASTFERCTTCNKKVPLHEVQSHADAHFAFQLSQEQRREYRSQIATSASKPPAAKRTKLMSGQTSASKNNASSQSGRNSGTPPPSKCGLLQRFLSQSQRTSETPPDDDVGGDRVRCPECTKFVPLTEMQEHSDFHAARKLQRELNGCSSSSPAAAGRGKVAATVGHNKTVAKVKVKSVAQFFRSSST